MLSNISVTGLYIVISILLLIPLLVLAVIVAFPELIPVTLPLVLTSNTLELLELNIIFLFVASSGIIFAFKLIISPLLIVVLSANNSIFSTSISWTSLT